MRTDNYINLEELNYLISRIYSPLAFKSIEEAAQYIAGVFKITLSDDQIDYIKKSRDID